MWPLQGKRSGLSQRPCFQITDPGLPARTVCLQKDETDEIMFVSKWKHNSKIYKSEYASWCGARHRCTNSNSAAWKDYGGRGIRMCDEWLNNFDRFIEDMGCKPSKDLTIERVDVNGNYEPNNCVWATQRVQSRNTRRTVRVEGRLLIDLADEKGIARNTLYERHNRGLPMDYQKPEAQHGTMSGYVGLKCRCDLCRKANSVYMRENRARFPSMSKEYRNQQYHLKCGHSSDYEVPKAKHGTLSMYISRRCRCDPCKLVSSEYKKKQYREKKCQIVETTL